MGVHTCYTLNLDGEDRQNQRDQPGMRRWKGRRPPSRRHFWLPLLPVRVSHVVASYIPEIIRGESTTGEPACRQAQNRDAASSQVALIVKCILRR